MTIYERQREIRLRFEQTSWEIGARHKTRILDELCKCGCYRSQHSDVFDLGHGACLLGHGECLQTQCDCREFTWDGFVVKEGPALGELPRADDIVPPEVLASDGIKKTTWDSDKDSLFVMPEKVR